MRAVWRTAAWKARTRAILLEHERCQWCNGKSGVINHRRQGYYPGYEECGEVGLPAFIHGRLVDEIQDV
jgi:hypothetical protein